VENSKEYSVYTDLFLSYVVEILPYSLRAKGFVIFGFFLSLSLIFNQYVTAFLQFLIISTLILSNLDM
jgi:hypothetical protein